MITLYLTIIFAFFIILLLTIMIGNRMHWLFKASLIIGSIFVTLMFFHEVQSNLGWPVKTNPPDKFKFISGYVEEPEVTKHFSGVIFLWYMEVNSTTPRAVQLPYDKDLVKQISEGNRRIAHGLDTYMSLSRSKGELGMQNGKFSPGSSVPVLDFIPPPDTVPAKAEDGEN